MPNDTYQKNKKLSEMYHALGQNITFSEFKKQMGIKAGRPKKQRKVKKH